MARESFRDQHPRDATGRPPTFGDFTPEGQTSARAWFTEDVGGIRSSSRRAAANAQGRVEGWREKNPGSPDNQYVQIESRRQRYMERLADDPRARDRSSFTMRDSARRIADNWDMTTARTARGDIAPTEHDLGAANLTSHSQQGMEALQTGRGTAQPVGADWYFDHGPGIVRQAEAFGTDPRASIVASTSMSPQNAPQYEREALTTLARFETQDPTIRVATAVTKRGVTIPAGEHRVSQLSADQIGLINSASVNPRYPASYNNPITTDRIEQSMSDLRAGKITPEQGQRESDLAGLGKGGTELGTGVRMIRGELGQEDLGPTGKVPTYTHNSLLAAGLDSLGEKGADANDRGEFFRRVHEATPGSGPYFQQDTLFGKEWEADPFGRAHVTTGMLNIGHQPEERIPPSRAAKEFYPDSHARHDTTPLYEGTATMDTWQMAQSAALPRSLEHHDLADPGGKGGATAAKQFASDPQTVDPGAKGYMPTPVGERKLSWPEAQHAIFNEVNNLAAGEITRRARAAGRDPGAGVPIIAVQSATWTGYRMEGGKDPHFADRTAANAAGGTRPTQRSTPKPGQDVPMFDDAGPVSYGKTWRPKKA